jgi:hypothetical protein
MYICYQKKLRMVGLEYCICIYEAWRNCFISMLTQTAVFLVYVIGCQCLQSI